MTVLTNPPHAEGPGSSAGTGKARRAGLRLPIGEFGWVWLATIVLFGASAIIAPGTVRPSALLAMLPFASILAMVAVGQTLVIQQRGLDMSSPALIGLGGMLVAQLIVDLDSLLAAIVVAIFLTGALGTLNGFLVARLNIMPIVATLATNAAYLGMVRMISNDMVAVTPPSLSAFSHETVAGIPTTVLLTVFIIAVITVVMKTTKLGRYFVVVGAAPRAAEAAGINVLAYKVGTYAFAAICFAVAGILLAGFIGSAHHLAGPEYLLPGIAVVVVGGTSFVGGRGSVIASGIAAVFMVQLDQLVLALGASTAVQLLIQALAIIVAVTIRHFQIIVAVTIRHFPIIVAFFRAHTKA